MRENRAPSSPWTLKREFKKTKKKKEENRKEKKEWSTSTTREKEPIVVGNIKRKLSRRRTRVNFFEKGRKTGRKEEKGKKEEVDEYWIITSQIS